MATMPRIFVSHSHHDNDWCTQLVDALTLNGFDVWFDKLGIYVGEQWIRKLETEVEGRDVFLIVLTPESWSSPWVRREFELALRSNKQIIGVKYKPTELSGFITLFQIFDAIGQDAQHVARYVAAALRVAPSARPTNNAGLPPPVAPRTDGVYYSAHVSSDGTFADCLRFFSSGYGHQCFIRLDDDQGEDTLASRVQKWPPSSIVRYDYGLLNGRLVFAYPLGGLDDDTYLGFFPGGNNELLVCDVLFHTQGQVGRRTFQFLQVHFVRDK